MALRPEPYSEAAAQLLFQALAREGLPSRPEATRATEAVLCALAQRIPGIEFDGLRELLPEPFHGRLFACERHAPSPRAFRDLETFYEIVAEDLERDPATVESTVRAVFAAMRSLVPERVGEDVATQLPPDLLALWRRPS